MEKKDEIILKVVEVPQGFPLAIEIPFSDKWISDITATVIDNDKTRVIFFTKAAAKNMQLCLNTLFPDQEAERLSAEIIRLQAIIDNADQRAALNRSIRDI